MKNYKNVLFINFGGIGDEILFLPAIKSFKTKFPDSKITLTLEPRSKAVKSLTSLIDDIICVDIKGKNKYINILKFIFEVRKYKFDCVISSGKSPLIALILFLTGIKERIGYNSKFGFLLTKKVNLNEDIYAAKMYHSLVEDIVNIECKNPEIIIPDAYKLNEIFLDKEYYCLHPGVSKMSLLKGIYKCPKSDFWINLIKEILKKEKYIALLGTNDDKDLIDEILKDTEISDNKYFINYFNQTKDIMDMALIMKNSKAVICVDSAPLHVAVGVGANIFAIFGPTNEEKLIPKSKNIKVIKNNIDCRPCLWHINTKNCEHSECLNINFDIILKNIN